MKQPRGRPPVILLLLLPALVAMACGGSAAPDSVDSTFDGRESRFQPHDTATLTLRAKYEVVAEGVAFATSLSAAPDGRLFVGEFRTGEVKQILPTREGGDGSLEPFAYVPLPAPLGGEQGLWNVVVHPTEPYVYVSAMESTDSEEDLRGTWRVVRFEMLEDGSAGPLEEVCSGFPAAFWHSGGALAFSADGSMYVSVGDILEPHRLAFIRNRLAAEPDSPIRSRQNLAGVIVRVDPEDCNPTVESAPLSELVYAMGFRNPYGIVEDPEGTLFVTENGPGCCDQVIRVEPGSDNGWPQYGILPEDLEAMQADQDISAPLVSSREQTIAPTEIVFYDGDLYPELTNSLVYGTFHAGSLHRIELSEDRRRALFEEVLLMLPVQERPEYSDEGGIVGVTVGSDGSIYFASLDTVYRITRIASTD